MVTDPHDPIEWGIDPVTAKDVESRTVLEQIANGVLSRDHSRPVGLLCPIGVHVHIQCRL